MRLKNCPSDRYVSLGWYSNAKIDELTLKVQSETDQTKRDAMIKEAFEIHYNEVGHIPLHQQALAWAMKRNIDLVQLGDNFMPYKWVTVRNVARLAGQ